MGSGTLPEIPFEYVFRVMNFRQSARPPLDVLTPGSADTGSGEGSV
ncbi:hypothetical protein P378_11585 [Desulforamulus profundi]|uniref:Uncharacterized protein n=1 Tax=Desulforamulus profundi TaxID=1383067 RepID=A0A2C6LI84_9FIRM|nr:hypothetical protein [Desulforamulus profundi]PHJ38180.1 hypothetical protein P378_11585 [Desulforamulus profundi]